MKIGIDKKKDYIMKGLVTISRRQYDDRDVMNITIKDKGSAIQVIELEMSTSELMRALTSFAYRPAEIKHVVAKEDICKLGTKLETKAVLIPKLKPSVYGTEKMKEYIYEYLSDHPEHFQNGWELSDDGTKTQQPLDKHKIGLRRWVFKHE